MPMPEVEDVVNTRPPVFSYYEFVITWSCLLENKHMSFHKLELKNFQTQAFSKQWLEHSPGWEWCKCVCGAGFCVCMSVCICVCVYVCIHVPMQGHVAELTKLNSCSRWTVWINKCCAWLDCSFSNLPPFLPLSLPSLSSLPSLLPFSSLLLSMATRRPSHRLTLCFQKPFVWLGSRTDSIMSEGQEVKKPPIPSWFSFSRLAEKETRRRAEKKNQMQETILWLTLLLSTKTSWVYNHSDQRNVLQSQSTNDALMGIWC